MKIVTGYTGEPHISANDDQGKNQGIFGTGNAILGVGNKFAATMPNVNTVAIQDGEGVMQGVHFRVEPGTVDNVTIENGTVGYKQIVLVGALYTKDSVTGVESVEWDVIAGSPAASDPSAPEYPEGDILDGDLEAFYPMFQVYLDGLTPTLTKLVHIGIGETWESGEQTLNLPANGTKTYSVAIDPGVYAVSVTADAFNTQFSCTVRHKIDMGLPDEISVRDLVTAGPSRAAQYWGNATAVAEGYIAYEATDLSNTATTITFKMEITRIR